MPALAQRFITVTQWTPGLKPTWTVDEVRSALRLHNAGNFTLSAQLVDSMGEDDELPGLLEKRVDGVIRSEFRLDPVEAPNRQLSKRLVDKYEPQWWTIFPDGELHEFLAWRRMLGRAVGVFDWERGGSEWRARFRCLHPQYLRYDAERAGWYYLAKEGELRVEPGNGTWVMSAAGQRSHMRSGVRALAIAWLAKQLTVRDWNRYNERHGLPIVKAYAPAIADDTDTEQFFADARALNSEMVATLPTDLDENGAKFDLDLLEAKDQSWQSFEHKLDRIDRRFSVYLLGGNLSTEVDKNGSRAATDTHRGVERDKATADASSLATELREQGLFPIVAVNNASTTLDVIPWPKWVTEAPEDAKLAAETKKTFGDALKSVGEAGYEIENIDELAEKYDLKLKKKEPPPPPAPPASPPGQTEPGTEPTEPSQAQPAARAGAFAVRLASGDAADGFVAGQLYADALVERSVKHAIKLLGADVDAIRAELDAATDYDDLRERLRKLYKDMDPEALNTLLESSMVMGSLAGMAAVNEDANG